MAGSFPARPGGADRKGHRFKKAARGCQEVSGHKETFGTHNKSMYFKKSRPLPMICRCRNKDTPVMNPQRLEKKKKRGGYMPGYTI